ncbi:hypothetical protein [Flavobacterium pectinovorum]|uniref:hypothetical protein n=1 Tax=Flavobacterium pectinovorum TaxID=29533 RepID=UPI001F503518|nr:hypothetical protein [Flavobacterium pectinovorum]
MGKDIALFFSAFWGVIVSVYASILSSQASLKHLGQRQSPPSERLKIGGKSLHQHLLSVDRSPQLKEDSQLEQTFVFAVFIRVKWYYLVFVRIKVNKKNRNCVTFVAIENINFAIVTIQITCHNKEKQSQILLKNNRTYI